MELRETARKFMLLGIGALSLTEERLQRTINALVKKGELSSQEGRELVREMLDKAGKEKEALTARIRKEVKSMLDSLDLATKDDLQTLRQRLDELEARLKAAGSADDS
jgi:poly(hydroxyalkanoate) granule-associated protein